MKTGLVNVQTFEPIILSKTHNSVNDDQSELLIYFITNSKVGNFHKLLGGQSYTWLDLGEGPTDALHFTRKTL